MKRLIVLLLLATGVGRFAEAREDSSNQNSACSTPPKKLPVSHQGLITITESGTYTFHQDVTSDILINADNVCFDLNCFTLQGTGNNSGFAILSTDHTHITIKNGTIKNPGFIGIGLAGCSQIHLEKLKFHPVELAIAIDESLLNETSHGFLKDIDASGNSSTQFGTMIQIRNGDTFSLQRVDVSNCTITRPPQQSIFGLIDIGGVENVTLSCCKINNNECQDNKIFIPLAIFACNTITVEDTKVNNNRVTFQGLSDGMIDVGVQECNNVCLKRCQCNGSTVPQSTFCYGLFTFLVNSLLIDCCEVNGTTLKTAVPGSVPVIGPIAAGATGIFVIICTDLQLINSEANDTTHKFSQPSQTEFSGPEGIFLLAAIQGSVKNCRANRTNILSGDPQLTLACGIALAFSEEVTLCSCEALDTIVKASGNGQAFGFAAFSPNLAISYVHCTGSDTIADIFAAGFATINNFSTNSVVSNVTISYKKCCAQNNNAQNGYGFLLSGSTINSSIRESQASGNTKAGIQISEAGGGFVALNPKLIDNCVERNGAGIVIEASGSNILNPVLHENKAIRNFKCGFEQTAAVTNPLYTGNKAQGNHPDFCNFTNIDGNNPVKGKLSCKDRSHKEVR